MKGFLGVLFTLVIIFLVQGAPKQAPAPAEGKKIIVSSTSFEEAGFIPSKHTCDGLDSSPPLSLINVPSETKSLVIIVDDPDAPAGTWTHWLVWNVDWKTTELKEGEIPTEAKVGINDFGKNRYNGPCPPSGVHRYYFRVYALDTILDLPLTAKRAEVDKAIQRHIISQGALMGRYTR
jgi:Raf kinase inhibitor-like YbhB/YbcL family protein